MTDAIEKLIAENRWNHNMDEAPRINAWEGGKKYLLKTVDGSIGIGYWNAWADRDENGVPAGLDGNSSDYVDGWQWGDGFDVSPTHFRTFPDDRLAEVCDLLHVTLSRAANIQYEQHTAAGAKQWAIAIRNELQQALSRANEIAGGGECTE